MKKHLVGLALVLMGCLLSFSVNAQCAMCKASVENNATNGEGTDFASGLNFGILYLFIAPYIIIGVVAFFWYRASKKNASKKSLTLVNRQ